ncbi:polysaccharide deacetylase family protein [Ohtaekwangia koreensis]|uniref:Peptidoglycan/xylan/chitin deacetylase, PgdA/CDA1 family n=1 Tax=Ohtaekwangia koreensis TaxID=688867 RepID=A0A1T5ME82_9BACT|nr:polysaccharide deacetylase family protein [Ohtaekwangia koreensis]SKC86393.1 Peptidoglycan/xylan/chitin deacetylase, PgdA/CDA1 family [Ohtaekwangia koreensis]
MITPHRTPFFLPLLFPSLLWRVPTKANELYLTFDDGPVTGPTEFALQALATFSAKATFFCIGDNIRKHPDIFKRILMQGHAVGNHTFNHLNGWKNTVNHYIHNIKTCDTEMVKSLGTQKTTFITDLFRPPYGRITPKQIQLLKSDYRIVMWDVLSVDYNKDLSPEACLRNTIRAARPGSIIVFHDSVKAEKNMTYALPRVLDHFTNEGFVFKSLHG